MSPIGKIVKVWTVNCIQNGTCAQKVETMAWDTYMILLLCPLVLGVVRGWTPLKHVVLVVAEL